MVVFPDPEGAENTINFPFIIFMSLRGTKQSHPLIIFNLATNYNVTLASRSWGIHAQAFRKRLKSNILNPLLI
jgi:hypothetical protein